MKKTLLLLALAGCVALPAVTHADTLATKSKKTTKTAAVVPARAASNQIIYYLTPTPRTGSNIPMVYRRYGGRIDSASNAAVYGQSELAKTGSLDVGTTLYKLDPSISFRARN